MDKIFKLNKYERRPRSFAKSLPSTTRPKVKNEFWFLFNCFNNGGGRLSEPLQKIAEEVMGEYKSMNN